jgi:hypothetical protein
MKNKIIKDVIEYNPGYYDYKKDCWISYERKWFCQENKIIHNSAKDFINCTHCCPIIDKIEFEGLQRMNFLIDNYVSKNLDSTFNKLTTEEIANKYNVKLNFFRPWI